MWPDAARRASEIRSMAEMFRNGDRTETSNLVFTLAKSVEEGLRPKDLMTSILLTDREEYADGEDDFYKLFDFIMNVLISSMYSMKQRFPDKFNQTFGLVRQILSTRKVSDELETIFLKGGPLTDKEKFYVGCILYALNIEGEFDDTIRFLYVLYKACFGQDVSFYDAREMHIRKIRDEMRLLSNGDSEILFLGWEDNHLRNAIAHMRMEHDESNNVMHFVDVDRQGKVIYDKTMSLDQFGRLFHLTHGVTIVFLELILIARMRDLVFGHDPFR